jgi:hypothetical protein
MIPSADSDEAQGPLAEIAAILAAGYLGEHLGGAANAATPPRIATCVTRESASGNDDPLDAFGNQSVHVSLGGESPGRRRDLTQILRAGI